MYVRHCGCPKPQYMAVELLISKPWELISSFLGGFLQDFAGICPHSVTRALVSVATYAG